MAPWLSGVSPEDELDIRARVAMLRDIFLDACQEERWAAGPTTCFAQAADMETWQACEVRLTADQRAKMQARLDAVPRPPDDIAAQQVRKIAFEYYPMWSVNPKHHGCPASLAEFDSLVEPPGPQTWLDPWGTTLTFACSDATMFSVTSAGPDRKLGTADDISSADE